mmetsp:Transcript_20177/g.43912  ORF Transcript_20177/g.43912 Transcript_20177/m.43912 type:complete len:299 (-) Transcript_20177:1146-2042(-)
MVSIVTKLTECNDGNVDAPVDAKDSNSATITNTNTSFIITGFGPFGGVDENPTTYLVRQLDTYLRSSGTTSGSSSNCSSSSKDKNETVESVMLADLVKEYIVLETSAEDVCKTMDRIKREYIDTTSSSSTTKRIVLLHLGVGRSECFRLELCAYNEATFRIPDQKGYQPELATIVSSDRGDELGKCYKTPLNLKRLSETLQNKFPHIDTSISTDPGRYVCNYVYCKSLEISSNINTSATVENNNHNSNKDADDGDDDEDGDKNIVVCSSLFLHVPHFTIVPKKEQLAYVSGVLQALAE